jgi:hypothetical protein
MINSKDHHHGLAAETGEGLIHPEQARDDEGQHDPQCHHVRSYAFVSEQDHGAGKDEQTDGGFRRHRPRRPR